MIIDVCIVGGGQAGLSAAYYLSKVGCQYLILEAGEEIGSSWKNRYDSLKLLTPRAFSVLPGLSMPGEQDGYASKNEMALYLKRYAQPFKKNIRLNCRVNTITRISDYFVLKTTVGQLRSRSVIVATGGCGNPYLPASAELKTQNVFAIHSSEYKNLKSVPMGKVLVVGAGNSGAQIAVELTAQQPVLLSASKPPKLVRQRLLGKSLDYWLQKTMILPLLYRSGVTSWLGRIIKQHSHDFVADIGISQAIQKGNIKLKDKLVSIIGNQALFADQSQEIIDAIIWATGFQPDFSWIKIKACFDAENQMLHQRGVTPVPGLYVIGLPWLHTKESSFISGVSKDARFVVHHLGGYLEAVKKPGI